ncbi:MULTISPECIES: hypothetical protein [unclassified Fibrobacter]|jgi:hypothetical protein|nr:MULTISPECIES: hypothetical protein [unclassified Fibrobacter]
MDNAMEQKKEYTAPEMNVVELKQKRPILQEASDPSGYGNEAG